MLLIGIGGMQSDILQQADPWRTEVCIPCNRLHYSELPCLFCVSKVGCVYSQQLPIAAPQCDISSEGEGRLDEIPEEAAPNSNSDDEEWLPDEVELNAVTIGNMSIDSKSVETDGRRGRYREITVDSDAAESVVNPDDWPNVDLKPSEGSVKGQRYVGPGGEKIDKFEELTVKSVSNSMVGATSQVELHSKGPTVSGVIDKGNIVVFDGSGCCQARVPVSPLRGRPSQEFKDVFPHMRKMEYLSCGRGNLMACRRRVSFSRRESLEMFEH